MFNFFKKKNIQENKNNTDDVTIDYSNPSTIAEYFQTETGITFHKQQSILKNKLTTFCKLRNINSFNRLLDLIKKDKNIKQELIDYLTTNESFFYREFTQIKQLVELVKQSSSNVDILCAPSSTGEEPYSIAIALLEAGIHPSKFSILGIDINQEALNKASIAVYRERNVRNLSEDILSNYFTKDGEKYKLKDNIKSKVQFKLVNIFDESFKSIGKFDFVFSRNMLIYFDKETKEKAKKILESMLKDNNNNDVFFGHADLF